MRPAHPRARPLPAGPAAGLVGLVVLAGLATAAPAGAAATAEDRGERYTAPLSQAVRHLDVGRERRAGYDRDAFTHWVDADGDGCDTRDEVLLAESTEPATVGSGCTVTAGRWRSWYDGETWTDPGDVDIDHLVPLAEAWDSGARRWSDRVRQRFANDLRDRRSLAAVTDNVNASKGDQDVREWLPEQKRCRYLREYVAVKIRWGLRVDRRERRAMRTLADDCRDREISVVLAR